MKILFSELLYSVFSHCLNVMILLELQSDIPGQFVIALLAHWLQVHLKELGLCSQRFVTATATEVVSTPGFAKSCEHITLKYSTHIT